MTNTTDIARTEETFQTLIDQIEGAADDFYNAYNLLSSTVELIKHEKMDEPTRYLVDMLKADRDDALALSKHLEAIADFSDTTEQAIGAVYDLIHKGEFGINCWNVCQGVIDAVDALDERGIGIIKEEDPDTADERTVYCAAEYSPRTMFARVTVLRYRMAHQIGVVDSAGPLYADLKRFHAERTNMLSAYNALMEYTPEDLHISAHEYTIGFIALTAALQALNLLISRGEILGASESADKFWCTYCESAEAQEAKTAILSAYVHCPIDIC